MKKRLMIYFSILIFLFFLFSFGINVKLIERNIIKQKKILLKKTVYTLINQLDKIKHKTEAIQLIKNYKIKELNFYVWISNHTSELIYHPYFKIKDYPNLYTKKGALKYKDPDGKKVFKNFINIINMNNEGFTEYKWVKPTGSNPIKKISFIKYYKKFNWIIGVGIYLQDIKEEKVEILTSLFVYYLALSPIFIITIYFFSKKMLKSVNDVIEYMEEIIDGSADLKKRIELKGDKEVLVLITIFNQFLEHTQRNLLDSIMLGKEMISYCDILKANFNYIKIKINPDDEDEEIKALIDIIECKINIISNIGIKIIKFGENYKV